MASRLAMQLSKEVGEILCARTATAIIFIGHVSKGVIFYLTVASFSSSGPARASN
jgi:hypothetical protein